jgi:hypothetical protein
MNIPLDNLYHWISGLAQHPVIVYVFRPHGSKDIFNLEQFDKNLQTHSRSLTPNIICHDQEPLNFSDQKTEYNSDKLIRLLENRGVEKYDIDEVLFLYPIFLKSVDSKFNYLKTIPGYNDWIILLHSEQNSQDVEKFSQDGFRMVYYWSHAVLARDWYRFAEHDVRLAKKNIEKTFLVYCRDWTPNREYRLKFLDLVVQHKLVEDCVISTQQVNNHGVSLSDYQAQDPRFSVDTKSLLVIPDNKVSPNASADYDVDDITSTAISVVLETVVDGSKIHLTEKILRPIACGHPFLLAAGPGALAYLRSYGFQTFDSVFDESYDQELDTVKRLELIIGTMQQIQGFNDQDWKKIQQIADYNKQHFFSETFMKQVREELTYNLNQAIDFCLANRGEFYWQSRKTIRKAGLINQWAGLKDEGAKISIRQLRKLRSTRFNNRTVPISG